MHTYRLTTTLLLGVVMVAVLAGCGRKSALDTPYEAQIDARREAQRNNETVPPEPQKPVEDRPFILDGLID